MGSCSKSSNKAGKQIIEIKTVINYSSLETGCKLCLQRLSYKSTQKVYKKDKTQKQRCLKFQHLRKPINNETNSRAHKNKFIKKPKFQTILRPDTV